MIKPIKGYEGKYAITRNGKVISYKKRKNPVIGMQRKIILKPLNQRYVIFRLSSNNKVKHFTLHRLLAIAFIPNPENKPEINHKNGIKTDNRIENLEWVSSSENAQHAIDTGLFKPNTKAMNEHNKKQRKLSKEQVQYVKDNYIPRKYPMVIFAERFNISINGISNILNNKKYQEYA